MKTIALSAAVLAAALGGTALAGKPASGPSPQDLVNAREAAMTMSVAALSAVRAQSEKDSVKGAAFAAGGLAKWGKAIPAMFPDSTRAIAGTEGLPAIWANRADFAAKAAAFAAAAQGMADAAKADDKAALTAAVAATAGACKACHDIYRKPPPPVFMAPPPPRPGG
jgi:cytochrome c556